ncbi:MAG: beta-galactosidase, partial [Victivallaceae bacterium]|nr:beta-galactosidase [Victivallaceae bacterium]
TNFAELPSDSPQWKQFEQAKNSPVVLAWYGKDEPSLSDYLHYLANKKKIMEMDAEHPLTSALHIDSSRRALGPMLEVVMSDIYPLEFQTPKDGAAILRNFDVLRRCRDWSAGNRVWLVAQAFSNRQKFHYSSRYSTPEEMNLTLYSAIAAGANGILFFIYNDLPTILDGKLRVEEFDRTLVDPWGNGNPVYDRIAEFGKNIAPIMPSFLDAASGDYVRIDSPDELLVGQLKNELGVLVIPVNKSTEAEWTGTLSLHLPAGCDLYDLETLKPAKIRPLRLRPGMGAVLLVATPEHFRTIAAEITTRRNNMEAELAELHRKELISAGFPDGKASPDWLAAKNQLAGIQQIFGDIYSYLTEPAQIEKAETDLTFKPALEEIKLLSCRYFELRRNLYSGVIPAHAELEKLKQELDMLAVRCRSLR